MQSLHRTFSRRNSQTKNSSENHNGGPEGSLDSKSSFDTISLCALQMNHAVRTCLGSPHNALHSSSYIVCTFPLLAGPSQTGTGTDNGRVDDFILSQNVYGESVIPYTTSRIECVKSFFSADRPNYLQLFRKHISKRAAGKGRAVLENMWLDASTIETCFRSNPLDEEAAVQAGLTKWVEGKGRQPPTWEALLEAMKDAEIAQEHFRNLWTDIHT